MSNVIVTHQSIDLINRLHQEYANKLNVELILIPNNVPSIIKFDLFNLLNKYNRIIYLSELTLVRDDCPNLFDLVPSTKLGVLPEGKYDNLKVNELRQANVSYNFNLKEDKIINFYNLNVLVVSRAQKYIFEIPFNLQNSQAHCDPVINLNIIKQNTNIKFLDYKFNTIQKIPSITGSPRQCSYIINYEGVPSEYLLNTLVIKDYEIWKSKISLKKNIIIKVGGGLGDQIESEPVVREICKTYKDENIVILSHWPEIFKSFETNNIKIYNHDNFKTEEDTQYKIFETCPDKDFFGIEHVQQACLHPLDFSSLVTLKKTLPLYNKTIKYELGINDISNLFDCTNIRDFTKVILIHPGKGWESKTFPVKWWESIINKLDEKGFKVIIIGKYLNEEQGTVDLNNINQNVEDLRDLLTVNGLFSLISLSPLLITNDSSPLHIAGAFDNNIIIIPTCKAPEHIIPFRKGRQDYKTYHLIGKYLLRDKLNYDQCDVHTDPINEIPKGYSIENFIPSINKVIDKATLIMGK